MRKLFFFLPILLGLISCQKEITVEKAQKKCSIKIKEVFFVFPITEENGKFIFRGIVKYSNAKKGEMIEAILSKAGGKTFTDTIIVEDKDGIVGVKFELVCPYGILKIGAKSQCDQDYLYTIEYPYDPLPGIIPCHD